MDDCASPAAVWVARSQPKVGFNSGLKCVPSFSNDDVGPRMSLILYVYFELVIENFEKDGDETFKKNCSIFPLAGSGHNSEIFHETSSIKDIFHCRALPASLTLPNRAQGKIEQYLNITFAPGR